MNVYDYASELTPDDLAASATAQDLENLNGILQMIKDAGVSKMIDLGCGYGGLTTYVARYLNIDIDNVYGVDIDRERLLQAQSKGIHTYELDLNKDALPFTGNFDLVISFGALEHLVYFDNFFSESVRILSAGGAYYSRDAELS